MVQTRHVPGRYPFNDPAPVFPSEMPWPVIGLQVAFIAIGIVMNEDDDMKGKQA